MTMAKSLSQRCPVVASTMLGVGVADAVDVTVDVTERSKAHANVSAVADAENVVVGALKSMLKRRKFSGKQVTVDAELYGDLGLDSLEVAELSAVLEDELGSDPYTEGMEPRTVGEVIEFYDR
jgi:acyl carrier protein